MVAETRFLTVRGEDVSGVGKSESGDLFIVFSSGATHHVKYNDPKECEADYEKLSNAIATSYKSQLVLEPKD